MMLNDIHLKISNMLNKNHIEREIVLYFTNLNKNRLRINKTIFIKVHMYTYI